MFFNIEEIKEALRSKYFYISLLVSALVLAAYTGWLMIEVGRFSPTGHACKVISNKNILIAMFGVAILCLLSIVSIGEATQAARMEKLRYYEKAKSSMKRMTIAITLTAATGAWLAWHISTWC